MKLIKKLLSWIHIYSKHLLQYCMNFCWLGLERKEWRAEGKKVYLVGTPEHDNIGDHAIALAEEQFVRKYLPDYTIIEIPVDRWRSYTLRLLARVNQTDLIFITGGGNIGDVYLEDEKLKRFIVSHFPKNQITIFPQTAYYTDTKNGKKQLNKTRSIFSIHKDLLIVAREKETFRYINKIFPDNRHACCPDMVFFLKYDNCNTKEKKGIGICFRDDKEARTDNKEKKDILEYLKQVNTVESFTTAGTVKVKRMNREYAVFSKLDEVARYVFTVTDRLHGMVFSIITGTTCLVLPVSSPKISSTMDWPEIKGYVLDYTKENVAYVSNSNTHEWNRATMLHYYDELAALVTRKFYTERDGKE